VKLRFYIQHEIVSGLKCTTYIYKHRFRVEKKAEMVGSFAPQKNAYEITLPEDTTPSGFLGRGSYTAKCKVSDDDKTVYALFEYSFNIRSDWPEDASKKEKAATSTPVKKDDKTAATTAGKGDVKGVIKLDGKLAAMNATAKTTGTASTAAATTTPGSTAVATAPLAAPAQASKTAPAPATATAGADSKKKN